MYPEALLVMIAAGPFSSKDNIEYEAFYKLLKICKDRNVSCLILMGPFLDMKNNLLKKSDFDINYEELFSNMLKKVHEVLGDNV